MPKKILPKSHGASVKGFHFLEEFKSCKKKFFLHQVLGLEPKKKPFQLVFGSAFHSGKEAFYKTSKLKAALDAYKQELLACREELENSEKMFAPLSVRGQVMLTKWVELLGRNDVATYNILEVEKISEVKLPNGFSFTFKPDVVLATDSSIYLFDTKTSWYSANLQAEQVEVGDQTSAYIYGWNKLHPGTHASGLVPDCIAWNLNSEDPSKIQLSRGRLVSRTPLELWEWEQGVMSDLLDMSSRVRALGKNSYAQLFPRTTSYCLSYNRKCPYLDICRSDLTELKSLPGGFKRVMTKEKEKLLRISDKIPLIERPKFKVRQ